MKYLLDKVGTSLLSLSSLEIINCFGLSKLPSISSIFNGFKLPKPAAAKSLAIPLTPRQSALFGVIPIVITGSPRPDQSRKFDPILALLSSSIIPSCSSEISNSRSEHIIPNDFSPLISPTASLRSIPGI